MAILALLLAAGAAQARSLIFDDATRAGQDMAIAGKELPPFLDVPVANLRLYADSGTGPEPIPFQVDEKNAGGDFILDGVASDPPDEAPGNFDATDEFVFLPENAGFKSHQGLWPAGHKEGREIELSDPATGRRGYVYLFSFDNPPPGSAAQPVRYSKEKDEVESDFTRIGFMAGHPFIFDRLYLAEFDKGGKQTNILDRVKVRAEAKALGQMVTMNFNEEDFADKLIGVRAGPIRVIRVLTLRAKFGPMPEIPFQVAEIVAPRIIRVPVSFKLPASISEFLTELNLIVGLDFRDIRGAHFSTLSMKSGTLVDGKLSPTERNVPMGAEEWIMVTGRGLNLFGVVDMEEGLNLRKEVHFQDDPEEKRPPEAVPGQLPEIGFRLLNWKDLQGGREYKLKATVADLAAFPRNGGSGFYKAIRNPLSTQVSAGGPPKVLIAREAGASGDLAAGLESSLRGGAMGPLQGLQVEHAGLPKGPRDTDLEALSAKRPDLAVLLGNVSASDARESFDRRGIRSLVPATGGSVDPLRLPAERVIAMVQQCVGSGAKVLFPVATQGARSVAQSFEDAAKAAGLTLVQVPLSKNASAAATLQQEASGAAAILILPDSFWQESNYQRFTEVISAFTEGAKPLPVFATGKEAVRKGAVLGLDAVQGVSVGGVAAQALAALQGRKTTDEGGAAASMDFYVNMDTMKKGKFRIPLPILKISSRIEGASGD